MKTVAIWLLGAVWFVVVALASPVLADEEECLEDQAWELAGCVDVDSVMAGDLQISDAWLHVAEPDRTVARAFVTILNRGERTDRLLGATSLAAGRIELHDMLGESGVHSHPVKGGIAILPGKMVELKFRDLHLLMSAVTNSLRAGDRIEITLDFENAGSVVVEFLVRQSPAIEARTGL